MQERIEIALTEGSETEGFREAARRLIAGDVPPDEVVWTLGATPTLFAAAPAEARAPVPLPRAAAELIRLVLAHVDPERFGLAYQLIWRLRHGETRLLGDPADVLVARLERMAKAVRRDIHKMHAFVRFRRVDGPGDDGGERFVAWFEPDHHILDLAAPFFVDRFRSMRWAILTPEATLVWDGTTLARGPGARREDAPKADPFEAGWRGYYESTFNPARANLRATLAEMPKKYWRNMPETAAIPDMLRAAPARAAAMVETIPMAGRKRDPALAVAAMADQAPKSLDELNRIIEANAPPWATTRAVLGEGPVGAAIAFVGEQPGDQEDLAGRPFVGPAGQLFDRALAEVGIDRRRAYVTNAVKRFKFVQRGKRRIHAKPTMGEIRHERWWLATELGLVRPRLTVALGATALAALADRALPVGANRGPRELDGRPGFVTVHPSYLLRLPDSEKAEAWAAFLADMRAIRDRAA